MTKAIKVVLLGDEKDLSRAFKNAEDDGRRFDSAMGKLKGGVLGVGAAVGVAGVAVGAFAIKIGKDSIAAYREHAAAAAQTEQVIKTTGGAAKVTAADVDALTESLGKKAKVDDDVVRAGTNVLLTFTSIRNEVGAGNDIFTQANQIVLDMSTALGTDLAQQAISVGKALNNPIEGVSALTRVGVVFTEEQKKQIETMVKSGDVVGAQKVILAELNREYGGTAEAIAATQGPMTDFNLKIDEIKETIGRKLVEEGLPLLKEFVGSFLHGLGIKGKDGGVIGSLDDLKEAIEEFDLTQFVSFAKKTGLWIAHIGETAVFTARQLYNLWMLLDSFDPGGMKPSEAWRKIEALEEKAQKNYAQFQRDLADADVTGITIRPDLPGHFEGGRLGSFQQGGTVPGPVGAPMLALVHGGETITPPGQAPTVLVSVTLDGQQIAAQVRTEIIRTGKANVSAWGEVA